MFLLPSELGFLRYLKQAKVPLNEYEFPTNKVSNIQSQLEKLVEKNYYLNRSARDGYRSYLQAYASHSLKNIFNVNKLDLQLVARGFGFAVPPKVQLSMFALFFFPAFFSILLSHPNPHSHSLDVNSSGRDEKIQRRGGGGGLGTGYKTALPVKGKGFQKKLQGEVKKRVTRDGRQWQMG